MSERKTAKDILRKVTKYPLELWGPSALIIEAMEEYASQYKEGIEALIEKYEKKLKDRMLFFADFDRVNSDHKVNCWAEFISELKKL